MNRTPTPESSQIASIGYDPATSTLEIEFTPSRKAPPGTTGSVYQYAQVPQELHSAFMAAESKGRFFGAEVKPHKNKYPYVKIS